MFGRPIESFYFPIIRFLVLLTLAYFALYCTSPFFGSLYSRNLRIFILTVLLLDTSSLSKYLNFFSPFFLFHQVIIHSSSPQLLNIMLLSPFLLSRFLILSISCFFVFSLPIITLSFKLSISLVTFALISFSCHLFRLNSFCFYFFLLYFCVFVFTDNPHHTFAR